mgnify:CR=1 FL=1
MIPGCPDPFLKVKNNLYAVSSRAISFTVSTLSDVNTPAWNTFLLVDKLSRHTAMAATCLVKDPWQLSDDRKLKFNSRSRLDSPVPPFPVVALSLLAFTFLAASVTPFDPTHPDEPTKVAIPASPLVKGEKPAGK